jgi:tetratricopeptide (TPR) repeat protein
MSESGQHAGKASSLKALALFEKGTEAALRNNFDYAVDMLLQALKIEPDNLRFRQALRASERKKFDNDPAKVGMMAKAKVRMAMPGIGMAKSRGKWVEVLEACEEVFKVHPWDVHTAREAAEAAEQLGWKSLAKWYLESLPPHATEDVGFLKQLARVYELNGEWERSITCWEKVRKIAPSDEEAGRKIKGLTASATITRSGLENALQQRAPTASEAAADAQAEIEDLKRQAMTPEQRARQMIKDDPARVGPYLELTEILKNQNKLDEAEKVLSAGRRATGDDPTLMEVHADVQLSRLRRAEASYVKRLRDQPHDLDAKEKLEKIRATLQEYELKEYRRRVDQRPEDHASHLNFGIKLAGAGRTDEAIAEFQHARGASMPRVKVQALYQLGLCFEAKHLPKLAERNYAEALPLVESEGDQAMINALHYRLGRAAEAHGDLRVAEEHYNEVAANDYSYEDVARRLENLNRTGGV